MQLITPLVMELAIPTTVRDVSISINSFSGRLKANCFAELMDLT